MTAAAPPIPRRNSVRAVSKRFLLPVIPFAVVLFVWWLVWLVGDFPIGVLPSPSRVWSGFIDNWAQFNTNIQASFRRLVLGFIVASSTGVVVGIAAGLSRRIADFLGPLVSFMNAISGIAWIPLAVAWFGGGTQMVVFIIWNASFFLIFLNTMLGVRLVPLHLEHGLLTLGASRLQVIRQVIVPGALPYIMSGLRSGLGFGWRGLIAAELVGASSGLGFFIFEQREFNRADLIIAGALTIGAIGMIMDRVLLAPLERRTIERWGLVGTIE